MRASRLLKILLILQNRGKLRAKDLAKELEVSHRTILRDVEALNEAGVPVISLQGNSGGIELGFGYRTRLTGLSDTEIEALELLLEFGKNGPKIFDLEEDADAVKLKLLDSIPKKRRMDAEPLARHLQLQDNLNLHDENLLALVQAIATTIKESKAIRLKFRSDSRVGRRVHWPKKLQFADNGWICTADMHDGSAIQFNVQDVDIIHIHAH